MSTRDEIQMLLDKTPDEKLPRVLVFFQNLKNDDYDDFVERSLAEADYEAEHTIERLTHEEVFGKLRRSLNGKL